ARARTHLMIAVSVVSRMPSDSYNLLYFSQVCVRSPGRRKDNSILARPCLSAYPMVSLISLDATSQDFFSERQVDAR
ncbi:hypothetical protein KAU92_03355, partial [Candidatus Bathyarchaeota archaeon]|nr:hypothetical protein [Candidatus Bathyarchaeota archaeon]